MTAATKTQKQTAPAKSADDGSKEPAGTDNDSFPGDSKPDDEIKANPEGVEPQADADLGEAGTVEPDKAAKDPNAPNPTTDKPLTAKQVAAAKKADKTDALDKAPNGDDTPGKAEVQKFHDAQANEKRPVDEQRADEYGAQQAAQNQVVTEAAKEAHDEDLEDQARREVTDAPPEQPRTLRRAARGADGPPKTKVRLVHHWSDADGNHKPGDEVEVDERTAGELVASQVAKRI